MYYIPKTAVLGYPFDAIHVLQTVVFAGFFIKKHVIHGKFIIAFPVRTHPVTSFYHKKHYHSLPVVGFAYALIWLSLKRNLAHEQEYFVQRIFILFYVWSYLLSNLRVEQKIIFLCQG